LAYYRIFALQSKESMFLQQLKLTDFKNCPSTELDFSEKINCFIGNNGAGKTNLLDAIYYLSFCKSYFNNIDQQNIRHGYDFFSVHGHYRRNGDTDLVSCIQKRNHKKSFRFNKKEYDRLADHIGKIPLVMISPYDRDLINEGSEVRRRFIDGMISQSDPIYLDELLKYNKALLQRNTLLRQFADSGRFDSNLIGLWDDHLHKSGTILHEKRNSFLKTFIPIFGDYYNIVSGSSEEVDIVYESGLFDNQLIDSLKSGIEKDRQLKYTTSGIHKDDLQLLINGFPLKKFGSQGQQKSFVIAIKLAQFEYTRNIMGFKPILLFDDIFDKLDDQRVGQLINLVSQDSFGQVFITDTQKQRITRLFDASTIDHKLFEVQSGKVMPTNE
jgi:DNA replication and repair protein RecF